MNVVIRAAGDEKTFAIRRPGDSHIGVGYREDLPFDRRPLAHIVNKDVFVRELLNALGLDVINTIEAAGKNQQRMSIGAESGGNGMVGEKFRHARQIRIEEEHL